MRIEDLTIPQTVIDTWQGIVDLIAEVVSVPAALIMKVQPPNIAVFVASRSQGNPYKRGEKARLNTGLYCETVMATRDRLLVPDATKDREWDSNPDIKLGMISYLGYPISWPNGDIFGTICILDNKENPHNELHQKLLTQFRGVAEADLKYLYDSAVRREREEETKEKLDQASKKSLQLLEEANRSRRALLSLLEDGKHVEKALRTTEQRYRDLFNEAPVMYVITSKEEESPSIKDCNELFISTLGYNRGEIIGKPLADFYSDESRELLMKGGYERALKGEFEIEERELMTKDGQVIQTLLRAKPETNGVGELVGTRAMYVDISELKQVQKALQESERLYRGLFENANDAIFLMSLEGVHVKVNHQAADMLGYERDELVGMGVKDIVAPGEYADAQGKLETLLAGETLPIYERTFRTKDGTDLRVEINVSLVRDAAGTPMYIQSIVRDITKRKKAEEEHRRLQQFNESIVTGMAEGVVVLDAEGTMLYVNPAACDLLGYKEEEIVGKHWTLTIPPDQHSIVHAADKQRAKGVSSAYEIQQVRKDGKRIDVRVSGSPRFEEGKLVGTIAVFADITERKQAEQELKKKMEQLDRANRLMVGRELRMIELKQEVNNLLQQAGLPKRYGVPGRVAKRVKK